MFLINIQFQPAKQCGLTVLVDFDGGRDLIPVTLWDAHNLTIFEIAQQMNDKVQRAKQNKDKTHNDVTALYKFLPTYILGPIATVGSYISQNIGWSIGPLKIKGN